VGGQCHALADLPPEMNPDAHCAGGWVGPIAVLDKCREQKIFCPHKGSNP